MYKVTEVDNQDTVNNYTNKRAIIVSLAIPNNSIKKKRSALQVRLCSNLFNYLKATTLNH